VSAQVINTVAGNGTAGFSGDGGTATNASLNSPVGVAVDNKGTLFIGDDLNHRVRRVDASTGIITTFAGNGTAGFSGDGGPATSASLNRPQGIAIDTSGNLFLADELNNRIRRVDASTGIITTFAGNGTAGFSGDGGPATSAALSSPTGVALDSSGNLYIADFANHRIRRVVAGSGIIITVAGNGTAGFGGDGGAATAASLNFPFGVTVDSTNDLFIADEVNQRIRRVDASTGIITTFAGNGIAGFNGDGGVAASASLNNPTGIAVDDAGNILIADDTNARIRHVASGIITTVAGNGTAGFSGDGGPPTSANLNHPVSIVLNAAGNPFIADLTNQRIRLVTFNSPPTATGVSISGSPFVGAALTGQYTYMDADGDVEGASRFRWLRDGSPIAGATAVTYTVVFADLGHSISFEVTPVAATGASPGLPVTSLGVAIVLAIAQGQPTTISFTLAEGVGNAGVTLDNTCQISPTGSGLSCLVSPQRITLDGNGNGSLLISVISTGPATAFQAPPGKTQLAFFSAYLGVAFGFALIFLGLLYCRFRILAWRAWGVLVLFLTIGLVLETIACTSFQRSDSSCTSCTVPGTYSVIVTSRSMTPPLQANFVFTVIVVQ